MSWYINFREEQAAFSQLVSISAVKPGWNDFGYNYHASASFLYLGKPYYIQIFLLPLNSDNAVAINSIASVPFGFLTNYATLFANPHIYQELARTIPSHHFEMLLRNLNEISYERKIGNFKSDAFIQSEAFRLGILRTKHAYQSLIKGFDRAYAVDPVTDAKVPFSLSTLLPGTENFVRLDLSYKYHPHFDDRVHCLIGLNGAGKTNLLVKTITAIAFQCNNNYKERPATALYSSNGSQIDNDSADVHLPAGFTFNRIISYYSDPASPLPRQSSVGAFEYRSFNTTSRAEKTSYGENLSYLLVTLLRAESKSFGDSPRKILIEALTGTIPTDILAIPVTSNCPDYCCVTDANGDKWSYINQLSSEQRSLEISGTIDRDREPSFLSQDTRQTIALSSGQRSMFQFALHFLTHAGYGTLLIIDEPETYLHPNLISDFMMLLYNIIKKTSSVAIIATHSAYVVREIPTHCVHILERNNGKAQLNKPYLKTLGANVSEISLAVFGDSTTDAYHRQISEIVAKTGIPIEQVIELYKDVFNVDMLMEIKDRISNPAEYK